MKSSAFKIERKSSIESEPRTLGLAQIQHAREAALYVLNTKTIEEALRIFTEGLEPVVSASCKEETAFEADQEEWENVPCNVTLPPTYKPALREVVTAPF